jgi:hypothetical protein
VNAIRDFFEKLFGNNPGQTPPGDAGRNNPRPPVTNLIDIIEILFRIMLGMNRR